MYDVFSEKPDPKNHSKKLSIPVGVAFTSDALHNVRIKVDAIPLNWDGNLVIDLDNPTSEMPDRAEEGQS
jgi:hypothetical protein